MFRKIVHFALAALAHIAVLFAAHGLAGHVGREIVELIRDEWALSLTTVALGGDE